MAGTGSRIRFLDREIRMVLVGKTGVGKSDTGNTICGAEMTKKIFNVFVDAVSGTQNCKQHSFKRFEHDLQLVDVPGFCDTRRSHEDIKKEIMKCVGMSSPGIHAILFVVRIGRFTEEDKNTLEKFLQCFGKEAKRFVIVIFTAKDDLEAAGKTLESYLENIPESLKQFLFDTSHRVIAVNNRGTDEEKDTFTKNLIDMVKHMVDENGGRCYTNEMYKTCETDLKEAEKKEKLEGKRQKELDATLKQETAAFMELVRSHLLNMREMEKQLEKERTSRKQKEGEELKERLKAVELRQMEEKERKHLEKEEKRQAEQKKAEEDIRRELEKMKDVQRKQMEEFERKKEDMRLEEIRKQIREEVEGGNMGVIRTAWQAFRNVAGAFW